ncbi:MAG: plasmid maintenance system killer protein [Candidatus Omnitrophota bacterium]|jgi:proteic killer suppression protein|nr:MAG: plasmid maintenance system killer protein [Candidatus Omnitrophota bacterium]
MIQSFKNTATRKYYEGCDVRQFRSVNRELAIKRFDILHAATQLADIPPLRSVNLHPLKGDRQGQWAISINGPWRICFDFHDSNAYHVELIDYHEG